MKKIKISTKYIPRYAGKWVAIHPKIEKIIAVGDSLDDISPLVSRDPKDNRPVGTVPYSFLVPRKDEGPFIFH